MSAESDGTPVSSRKFSALPKQAEYRTRNVEPQKEIKLRSVVFYSDRHSTFLVRYSLLKPTAGHHVLLKSIVFLERVWFPVELQKGGWAVSSTCA